MTGTGLKDVHLPLTPAANATPAPFYSVKIGSPGRHLPRFSSERMAFGERLSQMRQRDKHLNGSSKASVG